MEVRGHGPLITRASLLCKNNWARVWLLGVPMPGTTDPVLTQLWMSSAAAMVPCAALRRGQARCLRTPSGGHRRSGNREYASEPAKGPAILSRSPQVFGAS